MIEHNPNITCEFTEADWIWWYKRQDRIKEKETYNHRIQVMITEDLRKKITKARGDVPESIFLRKKLESFF